MRLTLLALLMAACGSNSDFTPVRVEGIGFGATFSPRGFQSTMTNADVTNFLRDFRQTGQVLAFHMAWRDSLAESGQIPSTAVFAQQQSQTYGFVPIIGFGFNHATGPDLTSASEPTNNTWTNAETRADLLSMLQNYVRTYKPQFLFLGNEVNSYFLSATPGEWAAWVSMFREAYLAIKAESPETTVFTVFQYEHLRGLGAKNGWTDPAQWDLLDDFAANTDAFGFTSYPYFEYETPGDVPHDYYTEIATRWAGKIIFTEIAWTADPAIPYTGSLTEHIDFVPRFFDLTISLDLGYVTYFVLHDLDSAPPAFRLTGLRENDGTPRDSLFEWQNAIANE